MWIFLPGGLLMPAEFPADLVDKTFVPEGSGYDLQIRARVRSHLENFIRDYADPLDLPHSDVQMTPDMDYNCRIYMRREDFAIAMARAVLDIDFEKFKPTAERIGMDGKPLYKDGKAYHGVLNSIWGTLTRLGAPGGIWSYGYRRPAAGAVGASFYDRWDRGETRSSYDLDDPAWDGAVPPSIWDDETDDVRDSDSLWDDLHTLNEDEMDEFIPASERRRKEYLLIVEGIPASQWTDWLTGPEIDEIADVYERELERERRAERKARKRSRGKHRQARKAPAWRR